MLLPQLSTQRSAKHQQGFRCLSTITFVILSLLTLSSAYAQIEAKREEAGGEKANVATERASAPVDPTTSRDQQRYQRVIKPLLKEACFDCHSGDSVEGNFRVDELDPDLVSGGDTAWWLEVYSVLSKGEMPPPESSELTDTDRSRMVDWLSTEIQAAEKLRKSSGNNSSFRRLTRYETNYALQDLFGVPWEFASDLPAEASEEDSFENNANSLHMSVKQVETYRQLALDALQKVTVRGGRPPVLHWSVPMKAAFDREKKRLERSIESTRKKFDDEPDKLAERIERLKRDFQASSDRSHYLEVSTGLRAEVDWDYRKASYVFRPTGSDEPMPEPGLHFAVVQPGSRQSLTVELGDRLPDRGTMRVRMRASRAKGVEQRIPSLQLYFGFQATDQGRSIKRISQQDLQITAPYGQPQVYQWDVSLSEIEHRNTYRGEMKLGDQPSPSEYIRFTNSTVEDDGADSESSAILIDYVEVASPVYDQWPPQSHRSVFIESANSADETTYAREIILDFMRRAWRRAPTNRDLDRKMQLFNRLRPSSNDFQEAIVEVLATILSSPKFLYVLPGEQRPAVAQADERLSQNELATRLSLFLWCSLPDEELLGLASDGRLNDRDVLRQQVNRMLADPRVTRFTQHFVSQWLKMQPLEFLQPTRGDDGLDEALLESMKQEPSALFADMLRHDSSILGFIDADYLVVNERLAQHYGIPGVQGNDFRRVPLPIRVEAWRPADSGRFANDELRRRRFPSGQTRCLATDQPFERSAPAAPASCSRDRSYGSRDRKNDLEGTHRGPSRSCCLPVLP